MVDGLRLSACSHCAQLRNEKMTLVHVTRAVPVLDYYYRLDPE